MEEYRIYNFILLIRNFLIYPQKSLFHKKNIYNLGIKMRPLN